MACFGHCPCPPSVGPSALPRFSDCAPSMRAQPSAYMWSCVSVTCSGWVRPTSFAAETFRCQALSRGCLRSTTVVERPTRLTVGSPSLGKGGSALFLLDQRITQFGKSTLELRILIFAQI